MAARKAISKKVRFEIFKRDGFCCAYCGKRPPQTTLEVDHINPVVNGGDNSIDNLITSCFDCNRGKGKGLLSSIPESLKDKAKRIKECELQLSEYRKIIEVQEKRITSDVWDVVHELFNEDRNTIRTAWFKSIRQFNDILGLDEVISSAQLAYYKIGHKTNEENYFKYFCGICWNKVKAADNG
jgi:hypothetical protein